VFNELIPSAWHHVERYADNPIKADYGRLKHRLRSMRGLRTEKTAQIITSSTGHVFAQKLRRGHCELAIDIRPDPYRQRSLPQPRPRSSFGRPTSLMCTYRKIAKPQLRE